MAVLGNIRVKHSMLFTTQVQIKNYLQCVDRNYLGEMDETERKLIEDLKKTVNIIENVLNHYTLKEAEILS
jgi:hypothetical protein